MKSGYFRTWLIVLSGPLNLFLVSHGSALLLGGFTPLWGLAVGMVLSGLRRLYGRMIGRPFKPVAA